MRILTRYILAELIKVFVVSLIGLTLLMIVAGLVQEAMRNQVPLAQILRLLPFVLPGALSVAVPMALLLATTSVYGRMSSSNEVVATKSLGISPMALLWPAFILAFLLSVATVWLNDVAFSWGRDGVKHVVVNAVEDILYGTLRAQRGYRGPGMSIAVRAVMGRKLIDPVITIDGPPKITVTAECAEIRADLAEGVLKVTLENGTFDMEGRVRARFASRVHEIPLHDASRTDPSARKASSLSLTEIPAEQAKQIDLLRRRKQELAAMAAYQMLSGDYEALTGPSWNDDLRNLAGELNHLNRLDTEPWRRWAAGFICLGFVWVGAPMAIRLRNRDFLTSFFLCFSPVLVVYYPLLVLGIEGAKNGSVPPYAVWTGNVMLALWGSWLLGRVIRY